MSELKIEKVFCIVDRGMDGRSPYATIRAVYTVEAMAKERCGTYESVEDRKAIIDDNKAYILDQSAPYVRLGVDLVEENKRLIKSGLDKLTHEEKKALGLEEEER